jgi:pSer/pThr/pTyr-binding forkhead associated (FHA) protein
MMTCPVCGYEVAGDARFCAMCGERLPVGETTTTMPIMEDQTAANEINSDDLAAIDALPTGSALLVVAKGPSAGGRFLLRDDTVMVGRRPSSGVFLDDVTISRKHAIFQRQGGSFTIADSGSMNGTYVNRILIHEPVLLRNGDELQIGKFRMIFFLGSAESN